MQNLIIELEGNIHSEQELLPLRKKLHELMEAENGYWKQRLRSKGDRNIAYFHHHANHRKQRNSIKQIKDGNGCWWQMQQGISKAAVCFF